MMSSSVKTIELRLRGSKYGPMVYSPEPQSDEESTEAVRVVKPTPASSPVVVEEDIYSMMNLDFALELSHDDEYYTCPKPETIKPVVVVEHESVPTLDNDEWMAMNLEFACDSRHDDMEEDVVVPVVTPRSTTPTAEESFGDYGVWWDTTELDDKLNAEAMNQMNQDFALESSHDEECYISLTKPNTVKPVVPLAHESVPTLADEEWMAMNQDFACDFRHDDMVEEVPVLVASTKTITPATQEPYGDYGVWWE
ncbi:expressed unknown protein [Seminavis robusta]|uniref:Uncharacterized protein n=1 Tax=Seminavis robusta TaxID=568900 RepID=A0A9N8D6P6_9STRA|nr:expressed unknown protein [Seminavis robusta]|eukprot:Sro2_g001910.1 n/a (253) ;mRNA; r:274182-274940